MDKSADAFKTISEAADDLKLPQHVLRFWETRFPQIKPLKRAGARRFYRPSDIRLLAAIRKLLYEDGYTIKGVQRLLKEHGVKALQEGFAVPVPALLADEAPVQAASLDRETHETANDSTPLAPGQIGETRSRAGELQALLAIIADCEAILHAARCAPV